MKTVRSHFFLPAVLCIALACLTLAPAHARTLSAESLLPEEPFAPNVDNLPGGWDIPGWVHQYFSVRKEGSSHYLRVHNNYKKDNDKTISTKVPLPSGAGLLVLAFDGRASDLDKGSANWQTAAVELQYLKGGEKIGQMRQQIDHNTNGWQAFHKADGIPAGADSVLVRIGFWRSKGLFDIKNLQLEAVTPENAPPPSSASIRTIEANTLLPRHPFEADSLGLPKDWQMPQWVRQYVSVPSEQGSPYLRVQNLSTKNNDKTLWKDVPLPSGTDMIILSFEGRLDKLVKGSADWQTAAVEVQYLKEGEQIGQFREHLNQNSSRWRAFEKSSRVPFEADAVRVRIGFWRSSGVLDIKNVQVTALPLGGPAPESLGKAHPNGILWQGDFSDVESPDTSGWIEEPSNNQEERPPSHRIEKTPDGSVFAIDIPSQARLVLKRELPVQQGKVYEIDLTARCQGQVELIHVRRFLDHRARHRWPIHRDWHHYTVQAQADKSGTMTFQLSLSGVGTFQIKDFTIRERDSFDLPEIDSPPRGELLSNGDFALDYLGWNLRYRQPEDSPFRKSSPEQHVANALKTSGDGNPLLQLSPQWSMLFSGTPLTFYYGRTYTLTVKGNAEDNDFVAFFVRPGQHTHDNERFELKFKDGLARVEFPHMPGDNLISAPQQDFVLLLRHNGNAPAQIHSVSLREEGPDAPSDKAPRIGVELLTQDNGRERLITLGDAITARVRTANLPTAAQPELVILDDQEKTVRRLPIPNPTDASQPYVDILVKDLPQGWYQASAEIEDAHPAVISDDFAVMLPEDPDMQRNGFLGTHLTGDSYLEQIFSIAELGFTHVRGYYAFEWFQAQPVEGAPVNVPTQQLDTLEKADLETMVVLFGTPEWASSMPEGTTGWQMYKKYPPANMDDWDNYVRQIAEGCGDRVNSYEIWNEPNNHFLHKAPNDPRSLEEIYAELVRRAYPIIKQANPDAQVVIGSTAGSPYFIVKTLREFPDLINYCDAISYHAYESIYLANQGAAGFSHRDLRQDWLLDFLKEIGRPDMPIIDSESGIHHTFDGPEGRYVGMLTAKGLVARQAAGFDQFYLFRGDSRMYPGEIDISNIFGYNGRPLVNAPVFSTWDRILGNATYISNLGNDSEGRHIYRFDRNDGHTVIVAWNSNPDAPTAFAQDLLPHTVRIDYLGRVIGRHGDRTLDINEDIHYYVPPALLAKLGLEGESLHAAQ